MSRSGYSEYDGDYDQLVEAAWRGAVTRAMTGKRGQALFNDALAALDAMPDKRLIASELEGQDGHVCALGAVGRARGIDMMTIDPEDPYQVANAFNIAPALAREIVFMNDEAGAYNESPEARYRRMRAWIDGRIRAPKPPVTS